MKDIEHIRELMAKGKMVVVPQQVEANCHATVFRGIALSALLRDVVSPWLESEPGRPLGTIDVSFNRNPDYWEVTVHWLEPDPAEMLKRMDMPRSD